MTKFVFVTGGVSSSLGKGLTASSLGRLLKSRGLKVTMCKLDPYLNVDPGTMNPGEHGEVYVTDDGGETDLDLGHYERFLDAELTQSSSLMSGRVIRSVIDAERAGTYAGQTVQYIPHVTDAYQTEIIKASEGFDVHIVEIGGTVGDYESLAFIEAIRELGYKVGRENSLYVHVVYMPYLGASQEIKTKPAQNAVRELRGFGISPDVLACRSEEPAPKSVVKKLSMLSGVPENAVVLLPNAKSIYQVPLTIEDSGVADVICKRLGLEVRVPDLSDWRAMVDKAISKPKRTVTVGVVAKYLDNSDTYMSVFEALRSAGWAHDVGVDIKWVDAVALESKTDEEVTAIMDTIDGMVVPGGFGSRGVEGKIRAARYALTHKKPYLGICYGLHMAVIAAARNAGLEGANTSEVDPDSAYIVIDTMEGQKGKENTGGTMRLGDYNCDLVKGSLAEQVYAATSIVERHRHRYECVAEYQEQYESWGISASGINPDNHLVEVIEAVPSANHPYFLASQFHPEFKSRPTRAHPMFDGFIGSLV